MKFFYCVRAATKENVALPNVDNLMRPSAEYINAKNAYLDSLRNRDTDHEQSSDADSDMRSESGVLLSTAAPKIVDAAITRAVNGNAISGNKQETEISTTTTATSIPETTRTNTTTTTAGSQNAKATTTPPASTPISNGNETNGGISQTQRVLTPSLNSAEDNLEQTPTSRPVTTGNEAVQRLSASPSQNNSTRNATEQAKKTNGNGSFSEFILLVRDKLNNDFMTISFNLQINLWIH